ncbi:MAG: hypothetical protein HP493_07105 [Nitrospira sp.]|nr:hypothetical protein [Nitrospira sp.]
MFIGIQLALAILSHKVAAARASIGEIPSSFTGVNSRQLDFHYDPSLLHWQVCIHGYVHTKKRFYRDDDIPAKASIIATICAIPRTGPRPRIN